MAGDPVVDPALRTAILNCIEQDGGPIFGHYKTNSLDRRLLTRLEALGCTSVEEYLDRLRTRQEERQALVESLMVGVTSFFRDPAVYDAIRSQVAEPLLCSRDNTQIRAWSAACSTGQEPYSLAILFTEAAEALGNPVRPHIFATDISGRALATAAAGVYDEEGLEGLSAARRQRWFTPVGTGRWKVRDELRQRITFAPHDITRDPAFPRMDLVCARNLLIYLNHEGQERALQLFHFALLPGGVLAVGESELTAGHRDLFRPLPTVAGLLRKVPAARSPQGSLPARSPGGRIPAEWEPPLGNGSHGAGQNQPEPTELVEAWFQQRGGAGFFLDDRERVVFAFGDIWRCLPPPRGRLADFALRDLPDEAMRICLRDAVRRAGEQGEVCRFVLPAGPGTRALPGRVEPFQLPSGEPGYLMALEPLAAVPSFAPASLDLEETTRAYLAHLELRCTHLETELQEQLALRGDGEERLRATNEELRAANEEQLSINEELRATTEELREKVAELTAAKQEIERSHEVMAVATAEKTAILDHLEEGVLYLTSDFRCQWANAAAARIGGRRVRDLQGRTCHEALFGTQHVCPDCPVLDVLRTGQNQERTAVQMPNGRTMRLAASPVCDERGKLVGVVEHCRDITGELQMAQDLAEREQLFRGIYEASPLAIMVFNRTGGLEHANPACLAMFGVEGGVPELQRLRLFEHWRLNGPQGERVRAGRSVRVHFDFAFGEARESGLYRTTRDDVARLDMTVSPLRVADSSTVLGYLAQIEEITQRYAAERERERAARQYREVFENANTILVRTGPTLAIEDLNREAENLLGRPRASVLGRNCAELLLPDPAVRREFIGDATRVLGGEPLQGHLLTVTPQDGEPRTCLWNLVRATDEQDRPVGLILSGIDVTARHQAEEARREQNARLVEAEETARVGHWQWRSGSGSASFSAGARRVFGLEPSDGPVTDEVFWSMVHPDDRALLECANRESLATGQSREVVYRILAADGALRHLRETQHPWLDDGGHVVGLRGTILDITQLRQAEEYWRLALDSVGDGVWDRNPQTGEAHWSDNWYRMLGMEPGEIPSTYGNLRSLMNPDDLAAAQAAIQACMERHADTYSAEFRLRHKAGHWVWILSRGRVMERDEQGFPTRFAGTQIDISARKATEERLARRERDLQEILEGTSPVTGEELLESLTLHLDNVLGLDYSFVSEILPDDDPGYARMLVFRGPDGVLPARRYAVSGSPSAQALHGEMVLCAAAAAEHFPGDEELNLLGIRGYIAVPLRTTGGEILGMMGAMSGGPLEDVDFLVRVLRIFAARAAAELEQRRTVDGLRRTEQRLQQIVQNMPVLVVAHDGNGQVLFWNAECERVSGYSAAEIVGNPAAPTPLLAHPTPTGAASPHDGYLNQESGLTTRAGATRTILWSDISARCPIPGWAHWAIGIDITEQRTYEESFRRAQKMSAVGELAAGVAHDFNNLLHVILGNNELLLQGKVSEPDLRQASSGIRQAAERGAELVRQLMYFSRRETFCPEPCDLNELVDQTLAVLRRGTGAGVAIEFFPDRRARPAKADAGQTGQVLLNLCLNARDAMQGGNGRIDIRTRNHELTEAEAQRHGLRPGRYVVIDVADTGEGIPLHIQERIFEPFFTTKGKANGSGLGLASAYAIMERHGGGITFDTTIGRGTTFHLFFPGADLPAKPAPAPPPAVASTAANPLAGRTILVAEDEPMVLQLAVRALRRAGATVLPARDGVEAVELFRQHRHQLDAVLLDAIMPRMNGRDAYLAMVEINPHIPALFASGYSADILKESTLRGLNVEVVQKPCPPAMLVAGLVALIGG